MKYTMDSTLGDLLKDPRVVGVLNQYLPGVATNPMAAMVQGMSLNQIVAMPQAAQLGFTKEKAEAILVEANKVV
jgi:hypothetical protein